MGFIDFEDNPAAALDIIQCQSRDWLCYLQSTLLILQRQRRYQPFPAVFKMPDTAAFPAAARPRLPLRRPPKQPRPARWGLGNPAGFLHQMTGCHPAGLR
ncbi:hypothetical protein C7N83_13275 [Neisseria iguanae]|uniref:Uncharacterized protein n=1 Tax=Neisseria iguanae TaxID=90242 RepID=A0A2P7TX31_9NEIS|nr:hypothetical protein C7N83_13275 [Neisseria iguanae]